MLNLRYHIAHVLLDCTWKALEENKSEDIRTDVAKMDLYGGGGQDNNNNNIVMLSSDQS